MNVKINDIVRFLNDVGGGKVSRIEGKTVYVEDEAGHSSTMTYSFYQKNVKPKPEEKKKGWVCDVCGYVYEGEELPEDFVCPLCRQPASAFERAD